MILIRGIKGKAYARRIEQGIVDCRDILSALLCPPKTGYEYSDYYEKNIVKALAYCTGREIPNLHEPLFLYSLLIDYYIPHIYMTYFHILNERSLEWLDNFDDDYHFIALDVRLDRITKTVIGNEYFGDRMTYVNSIRECSQDESSNIYSACMCSIQNLFANKNKMVPSLKVYNTLTFPLLCREQDEKFTDIENEFRIIAYDCPRVVNGLLTQLPRNAMIYGKSGVTYKGTLEAWINTEFKSNSRFFNCPNKLLRDVVEGEHGEITLSSAFKAIDIKDVSSIYRFLGGKSDCANYIKETLRHMPKDKFIHRTRRNKYKISDMKDAAYVPGYEKIEY